MTANQDAFDGDLLYAQLEALGLEPKNKKVCCPWHDDSNPSASILNDSTGHWRVFCHACNRSGDIYDLRNEKPTIDKQEGPKVSRMHSKPSQRASEREVLAGKAEVAARCKAAGVVEAWYKYGDDPAKPVLVIARIKPSNKPKFFWSFTPQEDGTYVSGKDGKSGHPVYLSHQLEHWPTVLVCEGEKAVDTAWRCGIAATTSNGGASSAAKTDWSALKGKTVVLWPDNDDNGAKYMDDVTEILTELGCIIYRIDPAKLELPPKGDLADMAAKWPEITATQTDIILSLMADAEPVGALAASAELDAYHKLIDDGKWVSLDSPLPITGMLSRAFLPGAITILCAETGVGKSFFLIQLMAFWYEQGIVSWAKLFEDERVAHTSRLVAQLSGQEGHTRCEWLKANKEEREEHKMAHRKAVDEIGARMVAEKNTEERPWSADDVCKWAEKTALAGARVIIIDPLTSIPAGEKSWQQDFDVIMRLKSTARRHGCSIMLTTHPAKNHKGVSVSSIQGGTAWSRFSHTILWLERHEDGHMAKTQDGTNPANRTMSILKCRNGRGAGNRIAMNFQDDLQLHELGLIIPDAPKCAVANEAKAMEMSRRAQKVSSTPQQSEDLFS